MKKAAIVTSDIMGPIANGGVGTAFYYLACTLAKTHQVSILFFPHEKVHKDDLEPWVNFYSLKNIQLICPDEPLFQLSTTKSAQRSYKAYLILKDSNYDVIHFPDFMGLGYYSILASNQGHYFKNTQIVIHLHGPTIWHLRNNRTGLRNWDDAELQFLEKYCLENADYLISPSQYMLNWVLENCYEVKCPTLVIPHAPVPEVPEIDSHASQSPSKAKVMFVGRMEERKGFREFLAAIPYLGDEIEIVFWGKEGELLDTTPMTLLNEVKKIVKNKIEIFTSKNHLETISYIKNKNPLIIVPSKTDNSPCVIHECLTLKSNFIWTDVGGISEMLCEEDRKTFTEVNEPKLFAKEIMRRLETPQLKRHSKELLGAQEKWLDFHKALEGRALKKKKQKTPAVSVCIVTKDRPDYLKISLSSLVNQSYSNFEILVLDNGSSEACQKKNLSVVDTLNSAKNIQLFSSDDTGPCVGRNFLAEKSKNEYLVFFDDDNIANPNSLQIMVDAALSTQSDVVTSSMDLFASQDDLSDISKIGVRWIPLGAAVTLAPFSNVFGDTHFLMKRETYHRLEGFSPDIQIGEDWDLLWRSCKAGFKLTVVPDPLMHYRVHAENRSNLKNNLYRAEVTQKFIERMPSEIKEFLEVATFKSSSNQTPIRIAEDTDFDFSKFEFIDLLSTLALPISASNAKTTLMNSGLYVEVVASDPQVFLDLNSQRLLNPILHVEVLSESEGYLQFFYLENSSLSFNEIYSISRPLTKGWNKLFFNLENFSIVGKIRLDFSDARCSYFLRNLKIKSDREEIKPSAINYHINSETWPLVNSEINWIESKDLKLQNCEMAVDSEGAWSFTALNDDPAIILNIPSDSTKFGITWFIEVDSEAPSTLNIFFDSTNSFTFREAKKVTYFPNVKRFACSVLIMTSSPTSLWRFDIDNKLQNFKVIKMGYSQGASN